MNIPHIDIDLLFSDPLLFTGALLVVLGFLLFLFSTYKFIRFQDPDKDEFLYPHNDETTPSNSEGESTSENDSLEAIAPQLESVIESKAESRPPHASEETVVLAPGVSDLQAEFEIAIAQMKQLNKKVNELEKIVDRIQEYQSISFQKNELKEIPMDAGDFTKKLLKVVEHVIVLEKIVSNLRAKEEGTPAPAPAPTRPKIEPNPTTGKPPVMPI